MECESDALTTRPLCAEDPMQRKALEQEWDEETKYKTSKQTEK